MREIRFRAWDNARKRMIFGPTNENPQPSWVIVCAGAYDMPLMQFTGLLDRAGKEIYEGDVVVFSTEDKGSGPCEVYIYMPTGVRVKAKSGWHYDWAKIANSWDEYEVIGDIYSNPELLK